MDSYQAVYDAVRSKINGGNIAEAVESAIRDCGIDHQAHMVASAYQQAASEQMRPSVIYRPKIMIDGNQWCALYGENLQDGVAGFGISPSLAMDDFDSNWQAVIADMKSDQEVT